MALCGVDVGVRYLGQRAGPRKRGRYCKAALAALLVLLLFGISRASPVLAHAVLVRSDPAANAKLPSPPTIISLYFSEPLEPKFSNAKVVDAGGNQVDQGDSRVDAGDSTHLTVHVKPLKPAFYSVLWVTVSKVDGHELRGSFPFIVLNPDGSVPAGSAAPAASGGAGGSAATGPLDAIADWLAVLGAVALFGGFLFALVVALPAAVVLGAAAEETRAAWTHVQQRLLWLALAVFVAGQIGVFLLDARNLGGVSAAGSFLGTSFGHYWALRLVLGLVSGIAIAGLTWLNDPDGRPPLLVLGGLFSIGAVLCFSLTSHAAAIGDGSFWATVSDFLHLLSVGVWVGGLISLGVLLWTSARRLQRFSRIRFHAAAIARFSPWAAATVALIILSGAFNAIVEVPATRGLISTAYGRTLLIKIGLIVPLLAVGALNAFILRPRLIEAAGESAGKGLDAAARLERRLYRTVGVEAVLAVLVILATGFLLILPPTRGVLASNRVSTPQANGSSVYQNKAVAGDLAIQLTVTPNKVGDNQFRIELSDHDGPVSNASLVRLQFNFADPKFGTSEVVLPSTGNGVYQTSGANFAQVGRWGVTVVVRRPGKDDALTSFTVEVPDAAGNLTIRRRNAADPFASPTTLFTTDELGGLLLVLLGVLPFVLRRQLWGMGATAGAVGTFLAVGSLMLGGTLFFAAHQHGTTDYTLLPNPVPVTNASVATGKELYLANCAICHGDTGHGDGPAAHGLNPQPVDLTVHVGLHADGVLWGWITYGIPRTAMPAWQSKLSDTERWDVVDFLRTAFQASGSTAPGAPAAPVSAASAAQAWALLLSGGGPHAAP
jgi:copper transport protein